MNLVNKLKKRRREVKKELDENPSVAFGDDWQDGYISRMQEELEWLDALIRRADER